MDINAWILNFRGIESAKLVLSPLCLIAGKNHQGKSSIAQAVAAAVTNSPVPFYMSAKPDSALFNKGETKTLVKDGAKDAIAGVVLWRGEWTPRSNYIQIAWPSQKVEIDGNPPQCGKVPAGLINPIEMTDDDRARFYSAILKSTPTKDDFEAALKEAKYPINDETRPELNKTWSAIEVSGWDSIYSKQREHGAKKKGAWERVAGGKYGADKAAGFKPAGYTDELAAVDLATLENSVATFRQKVQDLNTGVALDAAQVQQLHVDAQAETELLAQSAPSKQAVTEAKEAYDKALAELNVIVVPKTVPCPHCGALSQATTQRDGSITLEAVLLKPSEIAKIEAARLEAQAKLTAAANAHSTATKVRSDLSARHKLVAGSGAKIEAAMAKTGNADALKEAQDMLRTYESQYATKKLHDEAQALHQEVARNQILIDTLDSTGLRAKKLKEKMKSFNAVLAGYSATAAYQPVQIGEELETTLGGRHYMLLSDSEKYRCRSILQVASAVYEGSNFAIFDGADILDGPGRNGLLTLLASLAPAFHSVIVMTFPNGPKTVPDLSKLGIGVTYWIEDGKQEGIVEAKDRYAQMAKVAA